MHFLNVFYQYRLILFGLFNLLLPSYLKFWVKPKLKNFKIFDQNLFHRSKFSVDLVAGYAMVSMWK